MAGQRRYLIGASKRQGGPSGGGRHPCVVEEESHLLLHRPAAATERIACDCMPPDPRYYDKADELWTVIDRKTEDWLAAVPKSPHAVVARARYLVNRAWFYRGTSYAKHVPTEGWK